MTVVAIDGPAGAGKSTIARRLAQELGWAYLDTGAIYRAVTLLALRGRIDLGDSEALASLAGSLDVHLTAAGVVRVDQEDVTPHIRTAEVTEAVSQVAAVPAVREVMVAHQRRFARENPRVVAEGRDIGTVVFPDAALKVWLDAQPRERALRRLEELGDEAGTDVEAAQARIERRDTLDSTREVAPLRPAEGAWRLDTTNMTLDEVFDAVRTRVQSVV